VIIQGYQGNEQSLVSSVFEGIARCDLYIGIVGLRYGFVPDKEHNPKGLSITELEYDYATEHAIPRLMFLKSPASIQVADSDVFNREHPPERIEAFRRRIGTESRPSLFATVEQLKLQVLSAFTARISQSPPLEPERRGAKRPPKYRVFLSTNSADAKHAEELYDHLLKHGIHTFLSSVSLPDLGRSDFHGAIFEAIEESQHMIVVASSRANVESRWVKEEWSTFSNELLSNRKTGNLITLLVGSMTVAELPIGLRRYQSHQFNQEGLERLLRYVQE